MHFLHAMANPPLETLLETVLLPYANKGIGLTTPIYARYIVAMNRELEALGRKTPDATHQGLLAVMTGSANEDQLVERAGLLPIYRRAATIGKHTLHYEVDCSEAAKRPDLIDEKRARQIVASGDYGESMTYSRDNTRLIHIYVEHRQITLSAEHNDDFLQSLMAVYTGVPYDAERYRNGIDIPLDEEKLKDFLAALVNHAISRPD